MKKTLAIILSLVMLFAVAACDSGTEPDVTLDEWSAPSYTAVDREASVTLQEVKVSDSNGTEYTASITVKDPDDTAVTVTSGAFTASKVGNYTITYTVAFGETHPSKSSTLTVNANLADTKTAAKAELEAYGTTKKAVAGTTDYAKSLIDAAVNTGKNSITSATDKADVATKLATAKSNIDAVDKNAVESAEDILAAKVAVEEALAQKYLDVAYDVYSKNKLDAKIAEYITAIQAATITSVAESIMQEALDAISDDVPFGPRIVNSYDTSGSTNADKYYMTENSGWSEDEATRILTGVTIKKNTAFEGTWEVSRNTGKTVSLVVTDWVKGYDKFVFDVPAHTASGKDIAVRMRVRGADGYIFDETTQYNYDKTIPEAGGKIVIPFDIAEGKEDTPVVRLDFLFGADSDSGDTITDIDITMQNPHFERPADDVKTSPRFINSYDTTGKSWYTTSNGGWSDDEATRNLTSVGITKNPSFDTAANGEWAVSLNNGKTVSLIIADWSAEFNSLVFDVPAHASGQDLKIRIRITNDGTQLNTATQYNYDVTIPQAGGKIVIPFDIDSDKLDQVVNRIDLIFGATTDAGDTVTNVDITLNNPHFEIRS